MMPMIEEETGFPVFAAQLPESNETARPELQAGGAAAEPEQVPDEFHEWGDLVERIREGDADAMEQLYRVFSKGIRFHLCRQLGVQELDDKVHDIFLIIVQAIQRGDLREPARLMGFVRTVVRRQVATHIDKMVHARRDVVDVESSLRISDCRENPEEKLLNTQRIELMRQALREVSTRDREILTRFYLHEQSQEQICAEMGLSDTQFRLLKSRAKARLGAQGQRKLRNALNFLMRKAGA